MSLEAVSPASAALPELAHLHSLAHLAGVPTGASLSYMINSKLMSDSKEAAHDVLWPHNVGSATRDGCAILAHGIRAITEMRPGFAVVKFDVKNAHNTIRRKIALMRMARNEHLRHLIRADTYGRQSCFTSI